MNSLLNLIADIPTNANLRRSVELLEREVTALKTDNAILKTKLQQAETDRDNYKNQIEGLAKEQPGDECPFCHRKTGELMEIKPNPNLHFAMMGFKQRYYHCTNLNCGKNYDKTAAPEE